MPPLQPDIKASGTAWVSAEVLSFLVQEANAAAPLETGGVLLGYWSESSTEPVVTQAVGPGPQAIHTRERFMPDHRFHESEVARLCNQNPALQYLGDWHSHPGAAGYLSSLDYSTLRKIAVSRAARAPRPLMIILGFGPRWQPVTWSLRKKPRCFVFPKYVVERWKVSTFRPVPDG
jgi:integrative and conjugative element protein (TIGR02256 family)